MLFYIPASKTRTSSENKHFVHMNIYTLYLVIYELYQSAWSLGHIIHSCAAQITKQLYSFVLCRCNWPDCCRSQVPNRFQLLRLWHFSQDDPSTPAKKLFIPLTFTLFWWLTVFPQLACRWTSAWPSEWPETTCTYSNPSWSNLKA